MKHINDLEILFEDEELIAINKPAGVLTIPDRYEQKLINLRNVLREHFGEIFVVHRLDKDTSGVVLFAKDADTHKLLNNAFEVRKVKKIYHSVCEGVIHQNYLEIDIPLKTNSNGFGVYPSVRGKDSLTLLNILERFRNSTFVECNLITGRQHQIRAHLSAIGHPLLVDEVYGNNTEFYLSALKRKKFNLAKDEIEKPLIARITMHSYLLEFLHPKTNVQIKLQAQYPKDFEILLKKLRKFS